MSLKREIIDIYGVFGDSYLTPTQEQELNKLSEVNTDRKEPTGFIRDNPLSMGILEMSPDGVIIHRIGFDGLHTTNLIGHQNYDAGIGSVFYDGTAPNAREFFIHPVKTADGGDDTYSFYISTKKFTITATQKITLINQTGKQYVSHDDNGVIQTSMSYSPSLFCYVYGNAGTQNLVTMEDERHGIGMSLPLRVYLHRVNGTQYIGGMEVNGVVKDGTTYTNIGSGIAYDEDKPIISPLQINAPFLYLNGTDEWDVLDDTNEIAYLVNGVAQYNLNTNGVHTLEPVTGDDAMIVFIVNTGNGIAHYMKVLGQKVYNKVSDARNDIENAYNDTLFEGTAVEEIHPICAIIVNKDGEVQEIEAGVTIYDLRLAKVAGNGIVSTEANLDSSFRIYNTDDNTKALKLDVSDVTTGTTRTLKVPDRDGVIATTNDVLGKNILINPNNTVNQRGFSGDWNSIGIGEYGYDRWRKHSTTEKVQPIIEGNYKPNTVYTLSNNGVFVATLTSPASGIWDIVCLQTYNNLQLEEGSEITKQQFRFKEDEDRLCYYYYRIINAIGAIRPGENKVNIGASHWNDMRVLPTFISGRIHDISVAQYNITSALLAGTAYGDFTCVENISNPYIAGIIDVILDAEVY